MALSNIKNNYSAQPMRLSSVHNQKNCIVQYLVKLTHLPKKCGLALFTTKTTIYRPDSKLKQACLKAKEWAVDRGDLFPECRIANYLSPHCKVVAGSISALDYLEKNAKEYNLSRVKKLSVSGGFHSDLMLPAVEPFKKALDKTEINDPIINVYSNVDGKRYRNADHIRRQLPKQIVKPVKWEQLLHVVYERKEGEYFPRTFECGPGTSLRTILKQVNTKAWSSSFSIEA